MIRAFYSAGSGMLAQQKAVDQHANNLANVQTTGFKATRPSFSDLMYANYRTPSAQENTIAFGQGTRLASAQRDYQQGAPIPTGNPMDLSLDGVGFFQVGRPDGEVFYTRDGSFKVSAEPFGNYWVSSEGDYLLDTDGNRISLPTSGDIPNIDERGWTLNAQGFSVRVGVVSFPNPEGLEAVGDNLFRQTPASGDPDGLIPTLVRQGTLEGSNTDILNEMTALMRTQRIFQLSAKVVQAADEMAATANGLRP